MDDPQLFIIAVTGGLMLLLLLAVPLLYAWLYTKVASGQALIINKLTRIEVYFTGSLAIPVVHKAEVMDISIKAIEIARTGKEAIICRDNIRANMKAIFFVRINKTVEDVLKVAQTIGTERASQMETMQELFVAKFAEAIKIVAKQLDFEELYTQRHDFKDRIIEVIGMDLSGYVLDDVAIDFLEQTPLEALDPKNILDAEGIHKITELTAAHAIATNELENKKAFRLAELGMQAKQQLIEIERLHADALARLEADTGRELTVEQLEDRLSERLREMVELVVSERLGPKK